MISTPYKLFAEKLNALPNGFPATEDGVEIKLLEKLFKPEDLEIANLLSDNFENIDQLSAKSEKPALYIRQTLKNLARRGLVEAGRFEGGLGYRLLPFVVGIYEMQVNNLDVELAQLFETYFKSAFSETLKIQPQFHRVIPIGESVRNSMEVLPFENASDLVNNAQAWGVLDCICRKQKSLLGEACGHPIDVCMILGDTPGVFDSREGVKVLDREKALGTLRRAADSGLVHSVSNNQKGLHYICNCCKCSCGILRGMASLGIANVVARSAFINQVEPVLCSSCGLCVPACMFDALTIADSAEVDKIRCVGCGVCVDSCPNGALGLVRRPQGEIPEIPETLEEWGARRLETRSLSL